MGETHLLECCGRAAHYEADSDGSRIVQMFHVAKKVDKCLDKLVIHNCLLGVFNPV